VDPVVEASIDALEQTWGSLAAVLEDLSPEEWSRPTGCPSWDVKDNVSHISGLEHHLLGEPGPAHELPEGLPHLAGGIGRFMEIAVDYRRSWPPEAVLDDFRDVTARRLAALRTSDLDPDQIVATPLGREMPVREAMRIRTFDCYAHEQDIRRATGRPGNLDGPAAALARRMLVRAWAGLVSSELGLAQSDVVLELDGESHPLTHRGHPPHEAGPSGETDRRQAASQLRICTTFENALALGCGRTDARPDRVTVVGDGKLFGLLLPRLAFTP
jgi:uncharacterized protein (TIGR03083 family)